MKNAVTTLLICFSFIAYGQQTLPPVPDDQVDLHLPVPGANMRESAFVPAFVLGGFALVASKAESNITAAHVLLSVGVMGSATMYLAGDYKMRMWRKRSHQ